MCWGQYELTAIVVKSVAFVGVSPGLLAATSPMTSALGWPWSNIVHAALATETAPVPFL